MEEEKRLMILSVINSLIERFDDLQELTGKDFSNTRKIILKWAIEKGISKQI